MNADPSEQLQRAIVGLLQADQDVAQIIYDRVYDTPPTKPVFPYITLGPGQVLPDLADDYDGSNHYVAINVWSQGVGFPECKRIAAAVRRVMCTSPLALDGHRLVGTMTMEFCHYLTEKDGITRHAAMSFLAMTEPVE